MNTPEESTVSVSTAAHTIEDLKPKMELRGKVAKIELYGAFVDIGVGQDGLLHISQLSTEHIKNVNDKVSVGDEITVWVRNVDVEQKRIDLTMIEPSALDWRDIQVGQVLTGKIVRVEKFGAFIDVGAERPGMIHVSELANGFINSPGDVVHIGQEVQARVIKVNSKKKQIDLSIKALEEKIDVAKAIEEDMDVSKMPTAMELALRQAMVGTDLGDQLPPPAARKPGRKSADGRNERYRQQQSEILARTLQNRPK